MKRIYIIVIITCISCGGALAQSEPQRVTQVEERVSKLESRVQQLGGEGLALFLFAAFCALWAQNTGRSAWLWFFLGLLFSAITVLVLLSRNASDRRNPPGGGRPFDLQDFRQQ
jgi:hypothetical protein